MRRTLALVTGCLVAIGSVAAPVQASPRTSNPPRPGSVVEIRSTYTADFGLPALAGIAYDPEKREFLLAGAAGGGNRLVRVSPGEETLGSRALPEGDPRTIAFDGRSGRLTMVDGSHLVTVRGGGASPERTPITSFRLVRPLGATFDGAGNLVILDAGKSSLVRMSGADPSGRATRISLSGVPRGVRAVAFNPSDGLLYVLNLKADRLYGLDAGGKVRTSFTLRALRLRDPASMTFAPSADTTDDPRAMDLFIADGKGGTASGSVTEVRLMTAAKLGRVEAAAEAVPTVVANLVQMIDTSLFTPSSPDPSGIEYNPGSDRLMIVDSEVDEVTGAGYHGVNLWQTTRLGGVLDTGTTDAYTKEPTGLGFDNASSTLFISSDDQGKIFLVKPGLDGRFGTLDDPRSSIDVAGKYGVTDAEDPEFDAASGHLFFLDGINTEVYRIDPVNGVFGDADDVKTQFDVGLHGATDVEGLGSDTSAGTLLVGDRGQKKIYEVTKAGALTRIIDARVPGLTYISGLSMAPASDGSGRMNYWIADRAVDNGPNPNENDGKIFEVSLPSGGNTAPVVNSVTIDQPTPRTRDILTVTVSASDADADPLTYSYQWNKNGAALPGQTNPTLDLSLAGNGDRGDAISVRVTASDGAALGVKTSAQVTIVNSPPVFNQDLGDRTDPEGQAVTFSAAATDNDGDLLAYQAAGLPPGVSIDPSTGQIAGTISSGAASGSPYNVSVTSQDNGAAPVPQPITLVQKKSGDQSATPGNSISVTFDAPPTEGNLLVAFGHASSNRTPTIPAGWSLAVETGSSAETVVFYRVAGAAEPSTVTYSMSGLDLFMGLAIFEYRGLHTVQSEVLDKTVFGSAATVTSVSTGTTQPTSVADELLVASVSLNSTRIFSDLWTNSFVRQTVDRRQSVAHRVVSATGQFQTQESWDTAAGAATGTLVTFKRSPAAPVNPTPGSATDSFTWFVSPPGGGGTNQAPVVNSVSITPTSPRTNEVLTAQVNASDPDGDALTLAYQWIKNGIDIAGATGATLDLSVAGNGGKDDVLSVRATARDASTSSAPVTSAGVTVLNSLPTFGQDLGDRADTEGDTVSVSAAATDADGDSLTYEASSLPNGLSINPSTGLISGTIAAGAAANSPYGVTVTVRDAAGNAIDAFSWTVLGPPTPPAGLVATPTTTGTVLTWDSSSQPNLAGYNVYRSAGQFGPFTKLNGSLLTVASYQDTAAPRGTSYYRVTAVNTAGGESSPAETSATRKVTLRSVSTRSVKDAGGITVAKPSGVVTGDVMIAGLSVVGTPTITAPSGWSLVRVDTNGTAMRQAIYYKVATSSEPGSYKWTFSPRRSAAAAIAAYQGAASVATIDAHDGQANAASTSISAPGVSPSVSDVVLVGFFGMVGDPTIAPPSNMFERAEVRQLGGSNKIMLEVADALLPVSGPTGPRVATGTQTRLSIGQLVAIRPLD